ncbi:protein adenylyltransferase SelO [Thioalkalicoccus limnaeus]|uniref:Protein nucleotidyltransferase YdiU n=1 Tax=Thioalkalicoccus limnaeus TaxID=120681 RepID=A0ABV4BCS1_9GAMM
MTNHLPGLRFDNSFHRLPAGFHVRLAPTPVATPRLIRLNETLAGQLGLDLTALDETDLAGVFSGNQLPSGADPIATPYAGHQFGHFVPQLGDGRAILLGEVIDRRGQRQDVQLKGAGRTPFSRNGDGRAALGPVLREYLVSEAMQALGIPTTRALAAVTTGEPVYRESVLPGAILTRVAASHLRVGTFEYFAARGDTQAVAQLADYVIERHYPSVRDEADPYLALLAAVMDRQAVLVASWMLVGFIHGVMNTDNMAISGETIDYGPCAFLDAYDPDAVFSSIDHGGRYAFANQPLIAQWNLARLAETLLPLIDPDAERSVARATEVIDGFRERFQPHWLAGMRRKLGLYSVEPGDGALILKLLDAMRAGSADFTLTFRRLGEAAADARGHERVRALFADPAAYDEWAAAWQDRLTRDPVAPAVRAARMHQVNPVVIPRNHRVEQALDAAIDGDFRPFEALLRALTDPYRDDADKAPFVEPPSPAERVYQTFCGT